MRRRLLGPTLGAVLLGAGCLTSASGTSSVATKVGGPSTGAPAATTASGGTSGGSSSGVSSTGGSSSAGSSSGIASGGTASGGSATGGSTTGGVDAGGPLPTGTVTVTGHPACPSSAPPGGVCQSVNVSCPGLPDLGATVEVLTPSGVPSATVVMHQGSCGNAFFGSSFDETYRDAGLRVVDLEWDGSGWCGKGSPDAGLLAEACRPATLFHWIFTAIHQSDLTKGFCGEGWSGGSGAMSYALAHYGAGSIFDFVLLMAGPPFGRVDYGCDPSLYTGPPLDLCAQIADAPYTYLPGFATNLLNAAEDTKTCGADGGAGISAADIATWKRDGVVSAGASYDYPLTPVSAWYCTIRPNETTGLGFFYLQQITSSATVHCAGGSCEGEEVFADPTNFTNIVGDMTANCVPRH